MALRNIGPKTQVWLDKLAITTKDDLERAGGASVVYEKLIELGHFPHKALLYSLVGAQRDEDWKLIAFEERLKSSQKKTVTVGESR